SQPSLERLLKQDCYRRTNHADPILRNMKQTTRLNSGFSLLELLISMAITVVAVLAAVGLITKFARSAAAFTELSTMEESRSAAQTILRADIDNAGHNLTRPSPPLAGSIFAIPTSSEHYTWANGTVTKITSTRS